MLPVNVHAFVPSWGGGADGKLKLYFGAAHIMTQCVAQIQLLVKSVHVILVYIAVKEAKHINQC